jgi:hypothetical protein
VNADERDEITASVAAHAELGSRYDTAVAEGLVERIGEEIDRRVDARLRTLGQPTVAQQSMPRQSVLSPGQQIVPPGYQGGQQPGQAHPGAHPAPAAPAATAPARRGGSVSGVFLGLGSMGLGVGVTAVVVAHDHSSLAAVVMVLLIWVVIGVINIAHSQRR